MILEILLCILVLILLVEWDMATTIGAVNGVAEASIANVNGVAKSVHTIYGIAFPSGGGTTTSFEETFDSATDGDYTEEPVTGADEPNWEIDGGGASTYVTIGTDRASLVNLTGSSVLTLKNVDTATTTSDTDWIFRLYVGSSAGTLVNYYIRMYDADVSDYSLQALLEPDGDGNLNLTVNGTTYQDAAPTDAYFELKVKLNYSTRKLTVTVDSTTICSDVDWIGASADNQTRFLIRNEYGEYAADNLIVDRVRIGQGLI